MIKTLRITGIIAAVLAAGLLVFPAIFGLRSDKEIEDFLNLPSVVEKFRKARGEEGKGGEGEISPLVKYAQAFGLYLNPPKPTKRVTRPIKRGEPRTPEIIERPRVTPKFKLIATSFYASHPELSLALIDAPGKGRLWVREASVVNHLTIEQIKDGLVVVKGAKGTFEIPAEARPRRRSLLAGSSPVSMGPGSPTPSGTTAALGPGQAESATETDAGVTGSELEQISSEEQMEMAAKIFAELEAMASAKEAEGQGESAKTDSGYEGERSMAAERIFAELEAMAAKGAEGQGESAETDSGYGPEGPGAAEKLISDVESMRITSKEAKKLDRLGRQLKSAGEDDEQDPNRPKSRKVDKSSKKSWKKRRAPTSRSKRRSSSKGQTKEKEKDQ